MPYSVLLEGTEGYNGPELSNSTKITDPEVLAPINAALPYGAQLKTMVAVTGTDKNGRFNGERVRIQAPASIQDDVVRAMLKLGLQLSGEGIRGPGRGAEVMTLTFVNQVRKDTAQGAIGVVDGPK